MFRIQPKALTKYLLVVLTLLGPWVGLNGQTTVRALSGEVVLDVSPAVRTLSLEVTVRNHTFVVLPPPLGFVRPIVSAETTTVLLPQGSERVSYRIEEFDIAPVDYTIELRCPGCESILPRQYYGPNGNTATLPGSAYVKSDELPQTLNLTAITRATISGKISLLEPSDRDLEFELMAVDATNPAARISRIARRVIAAGSDSAGYTLAAIPRSDTLLAVVWQCTNCQTSARRRNILDVELPARENHSGVDIILTSEGVQVMAPVLMLL